MIVFERCFFFALPKVQMMIRHRAEFCLGLTSSFAFAHEKSCRALNQTKSWEKVGKFKLQEDRVVYKITITERQRQLKLRLKRLARATKSRGQS
jgi:hypothetical protein